MQVYTNEVYGTQVIINHKGEIVNMPKTCYQCHFWCGEEVKIVYLENAVMIDGIEFKKVNL